MGQLNAWGKSSFYSLVLYLLFAALIFVAWRMTFDDPDAYAADLLDPTRQAMAGEAAAFLVKLRNFGFSILTMSWLWVIAWFALAVTVVAPRRAGDTAPAAWTWRIGSVVLAFVVAFGLTYAAEMPGFDFALDPDHEWDLRIYAGVIFWVTQWIAALLFTPPETRNAILFHALFR